MQRGTTTKRLRGTAVRRQRETAVPRLGGTTIHRQRGTTTKRLRGTAVRRQHETAVPRLSGTTTRRQDGTSGRRLRLTTARRLSGPTIHRQDGANGRRLRLTTARRLSGPTIHRQDGTSGRRLRLTTARRLSGPTTRRQGGASGRRLRLTTARRLSGPTIHRQRETAVSRLGGASGRVMRRRGAGQPKGCGPVTLAAPPRGRDQPTVTRGRHECRSPRSPLLHHQHPRLRQRGPHRLRSARDSPRLLRLVLPHEHHISPARQLQQYARSLAVSPQPRPVVDVERDQRAPLVGSRQLAQQLQAPLRQRRRDPRQMQHPPRTHGVQVHVGHGHRRRRRPRPVVRHLMRVRAPVPGRAEVHARGTARIPPHGHDVDAVPPDRLDEMVAEPVGADSADPPRAVAGGSQCAGDVGLRAADRPLERRHVGEAPRPRGQERDHGLAERDDVHDVGGVAGSGEGHDGRSSRACAGGSAAPLTRGWPRC